MEDCGSSIPSSFGRKPRNIEKFSGSFKAAEWKAFILFYSLPLLEQRLADTYFKGWSFYVQICDLVSRPALRRETMADLLRLTLSFYNHYERHYFRFHSDRISVMKYGFHLLLHLPEGLRACGPLCNLDQFKMERYVGYIRKYLKSSARPIENISRNIWADESLKVLEDICGNNVDNASDNEFHDGLFLGEHNQRYLKYSLFNPGERRVPSLRYLQLIRNFLRKEGIEEDQVLRVTSCFLWRSYGRLCIREKGEKTTICSRSLLQKRGPGARWNCFVVGRFSDEGRISSWYGRVESFYHLKLDDRVSYLVAAIRWAERLKKSNFGCTYGNGRDIFGRLSLECVTCLGSGCEVGLIYRGDLGRTYIVGHDEYLGGSEVKGVR